MKLRWECGYDGTVLTMNVDAFPGQRKCPRCDRWMPDAVTEPDAAVAP